MIDFIKLNISYKDRKELLSNANINWTGNFDYETGEVFEYPIYGTYFGFRIRINASRIELKGSIHKLFNEINLGDPINYNRLTVSDCIETINHLCNALNLIPDKTIIENLEFGINLNFAESVQEIIMNKIIVWNARPFTRVKHYRNGSIIKSLSFTQSENKFYDKGRQTFLEREILRIEKKVVKNVYLKKNYRISILRDLINSEVYSYLTNDIIKVVENLIVVDDTDDYLFFTMKENTFWSKAVNPNYWNMLQIRDRHKRYRDKVKFLDLIKKSHRDKMKKTLLQKTRYELDQILLQVQV